MQFDRKRFSIPRLKGKKIPDKLNLSIRSAHAGIINDNNLFYTPKSLVHGKNSLKEFYKPLQKAHYSHTLGYIFDAEYEKLHEVGTIDSSKSPEELVFNVKSYIKSKDYKKDGLGVLHSKALLYNKDKINSLYNHEDIGFVSVAGDSAAYCSICSKEAQLCEHRRGDYYNGEVCFNIIDILKIDHISFESIPADTRTRTTVLDSKEHLDTVTVIEGQSMKLTIEEFKEYLKNIDTVFEDLDLTAYLSTYKRIAETATASDFLFPKDQLGLLTTKLGVVLLTKALDKVEESEDLVVLRSIVTKEYNKLLGEDIDLDAAIAALELTPEPEVIVDPEPTVEDVPVIVEEPEVVLETPVQDSFASATFDMLKQSMQDMFTAELNKVTATLSKLVGEIVDTKTNKYYDDRVEALEAKVTLSESSTGKLTDELKNSLLSQIVLAKGLDVESEYYQKLQTRSVRELKLTLEDVSISPILTKEVIPVVVEDVPAVELETLDKDAVTAEMSVVEDPILSTPVQDSDTIVTEILTSLTGVKLLDKSSYRTLYNDTFDKHGRTVAKKLYTTLKDRSMI